MTEFWPTLAVVGYLAGFVSTLHTGYTVHRRAAAGKLSSTYRDLLYKTHLRRFISALIWPIHLVIGLVIVAFWMYYIRKQRRLAKRGQGNAT